MLFKDSIRAYVRIKRLRYKEQILNSVSLNNPCLLLQLYKTHKYKFCGLRSEFFIIKPGTCWKRTRWACNLVKHHSVGLAGRWTTNLPIYFNIFNLYWFYVGPKKELNSIIKWRIIKKISILLCLYRIEIKLVMPENKIWFRCVQSTDRQTDSLLISNLNST